MDMMQEFIDWNKTIEPDIVYVHNLISRKLDDQPMGLINDLQEVECWNSRIGALLAQADSWLDRYSLVAMPPKNPDRSEADRKAILDSETSPIRLVRDTCENLLDAIRQRLILGESCLSFFRETYADHGIPTGSGVKSVH